MTFLAPHRLRNFAPRNCANGVALKKIFCRRRRHLPYLANATKLKNTDILIDLVATDTPLQPIRSKS
jgi:hypothetical protein